MPNSAVTPATSSADVLPAAGRRGSAVVGRPDGILLTDPSGNAVLVARDPA